MHVIAGVDLNGAGEAGRRRVDVAIGQIERGGLDVRLVHVHRALVLLDDESLVGRLLLSDRILGFQFLVAGEIGFGFGENRLVMGELRFRLIQRRLIRPRIDEEQRIARRHLLTPGEIGLHHLAADAGLNGYGLDRRHGPERIEHDRLVAPLDDGDRDRNRRCDRSRRRRGRQKPRSFDLRCDGDDNDGDGAKR